MEKKFHNTFFLLLAAALFFSCGTSVDIAKRKYFKGYYVHVSEKAKKKNETRISETTSPPLCNSPKKYFAENEIKKNESLQTASTEKKPIISFDKKNFLKNNFEKKENL